MKTKKIPALVMLIGGSVACIVAYLNHYDLEDMLVALIVSLIVFFCLGLLVEFLFEKFEIAKEDAEPLGDGEVVEKTSENQDEESVDTQSDGNDNEGANADIGDGQAS